MNRRTLYRVLAVVVALAAISPQLLEVDSDGGNQQIPSRAAGDSSVPGIRPLASEAPLHH